MHLFSGWLKGIVLRALKFDYIQINTGYEILIKIEINDKDQYWWLLVLPIRLTAV